jgi:parallel beta helix pectate lyase-like protein
VRRNVGVRTVRRSLGCAIGVAAVAGIVAAAPAGAATTDVFPGDSIQSAVNGAEPGDAIVVHAGVYRQSVKINKNHLALRGAGDSRDGSVIKPPREHVDRCFDGTSGICVRRHETSHADHVRTVGTRISGFRIRGFPDSGVLTLGAKGTIVRNNTFVHNEGYGAAAFDSRGTKFLHNVAKNAEEAGLYIGDSPHANAVLRGNRVRHNHDFGFFLRDSSHALVVHNRAVQNCLGIGLINTGAPGGVHDWRVRDNRVLRNQRNCPGGPESPPISGTGIGLLGARGNLVRNNVVNGNRPAGPAAAPGGIVVVSSAFLGGSVSAHNRIAHNRAHRNQPDDIVWDGNGQGNQFVGNRCGSSQPGGLCD